MDMIVIKKLISWYFRFLSYISPTAVGKQAFYLFCVPFKAKLKLKHQVFLDTSIKKELMIEGKKVQAYRWGNGHTKIIMVHGWQSNAYRWRKYIEQLDKSKYTLIAFDAPGHGNSEGLFCNVPLYEKTLRGIVDHYGKPDCMITHSIGAFSSLYFLHKNEFEVDKFISMASPFSAEQFTKVYKAELNLSPRVVKQLEVYFNQYTGHPISYYSLDNFAPAIGARTLLIHDQKDKVTNINNSIKLNEKLRSSELWATDGYGHSLRSENVVRKVSKFIES